MDAAEAVVVLAVVVAALLLAYLAAEPLIHRAGAALRRLAEGSAPR